MIPIPYIFFEQTLPKFADVQSSPILSMNEIAHMSCPESCFPNLQVLSEQSCEPHCEPVIDSRQMNSKYFWSVAQWSTGFNDDRETVTKQNSELDIWVHQ